MKTIVWLLALLLDPQSDWVREVARINLNNVSVYSESREFHMSVSDGTNFSVHGPSGDWSFESPMRFSRQLELSNSGKVAAVASEIVTTGEMSVTLFFQTQSPWSVSKNELSRSFPSLEAQPLTRRQFNQQENGTRKLIQFVPGTSILAVWYSLSNSWIGLDAEKRQIRELSLAEREAARQAALTKAIFSLLLNDIPPELPFAPDPLRPSSDQYRLYNPTSALFIANSGEDTDITKLLMLLLQSHDTLFTERKTRQKLIVTNNLRIQLLKIIAALKNKDKPATRFDLEERDGLIAEPHFRFQLGALHTRRSDLGFVLLLEKRGEIGDRGPMRFSYSSEIITDATSLFSGKFFDIWIKVLPTGHYTASLWVFHRDDPLPSYKSEFSIDLKTGINETTISHFDKLE